MVEHLVTYDPLTPHPEPEEREAKSCHHVCPHDMFVFTQF